MDHKKQGQSSVEPLLVKVTNVVTHEVVNDILQNYNSLLEVVRFDTAKGTIAGDNFCSLMYSVLITARDKSTGEITEIPVMFKAIPRNPVRVKLVNDAMLFLKECEMYQTVIPKLSISGSSFTAYPKTYNVFYDGVRDYIAMENLRTLGFQMVDRIQGLDTTHATIVMKELAKFHALSFLKYKGDGLKMLAEFPYLVETLWQSPESVSDMNKFFVDNTFKEVLKIVDEEEGYHNRRGLQWLTTDIFAKMHELTTVSEKFPSVITLGDVWTNNIMFRHNSNGEPIELKFLDFQLAKIGSRVLDLAYVLFTSLSIPLLKTEIMIFVRIYFDAFTLHCNELGAKSPLTFKCQELTWTFFQEEFWHYTRYGTTMALYLLPIMTANPGDVIDLETLTDTPDVNNANDEKNNKIWTFPPTRAKLLNIIDNHLPMCFKPVQN